MGHAFLYSYEVMATVSDWTLDSQCQDDGKSKFCNAVLLYLNKMDFRIVPIREIAMFSYNQELKLWEAILVGEKHAIRLKRSWTNRQLLSLSSCLVQVSQKTIVNMMFLKAVQNNHCVFYSPLDQISDVTVTRQYKRILIGKFFQL